jgi:hypothetical protein
LIRPGFVLSLLGLLFLGICSAPLFSWWPPQWMERRARRQSVMNRVEAVGGWERLSADLALLLTTNNSPGLRISVSSTSNGLPPSLSALRLRSIELNPFQRSNSALLIFYFPRRHHAGYSIFVVTSGTNAAADVELLRSRWRRSTSVQQLTNGIYEVY